ncbi:MAG: anaerobic sulfatase maturase [Acidimicrobiales bacterium]|jgi:uncharacterized protein
MENGPTRVAEPFVVMAKPVGPICNLDCAYCYYLKKKDLFPAGEPFRMRPEVLESYVASFIASSPGPVVHFGWHGGEPTLAGIDFYSQVVELQRRFLPEGWQCLNNLQTNGTLLDESWCAFLAEHHFAVGLSLDGPADLHDAFRSDRHGQPTHHRVMRGLRLLRSAGIEPDILCTLNALNAEDPTRVYRFFVDEGARWLQFLPVVEQAPGGGVSERSVTPEAMGEFLVKVFDEWVRHDVERLGVQNFLECYLVAAGKPANICVMSESCGRVLAMEHDGSVYACDHFVEPGHRLGELGLDGFAPLVEATEQRGFGEAKRDALPGCCLSCPMRRFCNGGCPKDRFAASPEGEAGLNYLCEGYLRFYSHVAPYVERMAALSLDGQPISGISEELAAAEHDELAVWNAAGRNDLCPCGSGRKFKHCCLASRRR